MTPETDILGATLAGLFDAPVRVAYAEPRLQSDALFPEELPYVARAVEKRCAEFATGRMLARRLLASLGHPPAPLLPGPDRAPVWPTTVAGSISHTQGCCAVALAPMPPFAGLGLDIERAAPLAARPVAMVCTPAEQRRLCALDADWRGLAATILFSAKEALYKCQYPCIGARLGFQDVTLRVDREASRFAVEDIDVRSEDRNRFNAVRGRFALADGFIVSSAVLMC